MDRKHNPKLTSLAKTLRKNMTPWERKLWYEFLRNYPVRFLRQKVIDDYIVDFYCSKARLVIELDGSQHFGKSGMDADKIRQENIESRDLKVIRIPNNEIDDNFQLICDFIDSTVKKRLNELSECG